VDVPKHNTDGRGDRTCDNEVLPRDASTAKERANSNADEAYLQLRQTALYPADQHGFDNDMFGLFVFDNDAGAYGLLARDADDEVELMDGGDTRFHFECCNPMS
jgi:hypothetical protein